MRIIQGVIIVLIAVALARVGASQVARRGPKATAPRSAMLDVSPPLVAPARPVPDLAPPTGDSDVAEHWQAGPVGLSYGAFTLDLAGLTLAGMEGRFHYCFESAIAGGVALVAASGVAPAIDAAGIPRC
jgi:hypothetical protein